MRKLILVAVFALAFCGVSRADSYTVTSAQGQAVINEVNTVIADNPIAYLFNGGAQSAYTTGLTDYSLGFTLQGLGLISLADNDFNAAAAAFNTVLKDLGSSDPVSFVANAAEPTTLLMLALGIVGILVLRKKISATA
jgi:hypothetical protein